MISPRLIADPRLPALANRKPPGVCARGPAIFLALHASAPPRNRTSSSVAPIHSSAGPKNIYTDSDSVGFESGLTIAENPVLAVNQ